MKTPTDPDDGHGFYVLEDIGGSYFLRHWVRYNLREAAESSARFMFRHEPNLAVGLWRGEWSEIQPIPG